MEFSDMDMIILKSFTLKKSVRFNTGASLDPEQVQQDDSEPDTQSEFNQGTREPKNNSSLLALIEFRIQQLHSRRLILLKIQNFRKKAEDNSGRTTEETTAEDNDRQCELEAIQKELGDLLVKRKELKKQENKFKLGQPIVHCNFRKTPHGGVYLLPHLHQEGLTLQTVKTRIDADILTGPVVSVDSLSQTSAVTTCPSCKEVVLTETHSKVGEAGWVFCCLSSLMGGIAGCCLLPFFVDRLKNVHHHCSNCQAHIHTYKPF